MDNVLVQDANNEDKWTELRHNGPYFWKPFQPLKASAMLEYDGQSIKLTAAAEELAVAYANTTKHRKTDCFNKNFFEDWRSKMTDEERQIISDISKCKFKKYMNKNLVESDPNIEQQYSFCWIDGKQEKIGNWKVERPGLFKGSAGNLNCGKWKRRIVPEDVTINCSPGHEPPAPEGHRWGNVVENKKTLWLAKWQDPVHNSCWKYIELCRSSNPKAIAHYQKFNVAKEFGEDVEDIRRSYREYIQSDVILEKKLGIALYLIDQFVFRAGNEKTDPDDAYTVGCCSLRVVHITLHGEAKEIEFNFPSKGCQPFQRKQKIDIQAFEVLEQLIAGKEPTDKIFNKLTPDKVNKVLKDFNSEYTTKVFRTFRASALFEKKLRKTSQNIINEEKVKVFERAALAVAELCNHMRKDKNLEKEISKNKKILEQPATHPHLAPFVERENKIISNKVKTLEAKANSGEPAFQTTMDNYIDPRIVVAWCIQHGVPIEDVYSQKQRKWFKWAIDLAIPEYVFYMPPQSNEPEPGPSGQSAKNMQQLKLDPFLIEKETLPTSKAQKRKHD